MENVNLNKLIGKEIPLRYNGGDFYLGKIIKSEINGRDYFHSILKSKEKGKDCIKTIFLREDNLKYLDGKVLWSDKNFCPIWTCYKPTKNLGKDNNMFAKEYFELERLLNN